MTTETRLAECTAPASTLFMSLELGSKRWKVAFTTGASHRPRVVQLVAGDLGRLWAEVTRAKGRFGLSADTVVRGCYEAGRDGFWLHRALTAQGVLSVVVDPSSIVVDRRARRAKTDRIDATALVIQLMHAAAGDRRGWRALHVPSAQAEADRQLQREWETVCADRTRIRNRVQGLLATQGVRLPLTRHFTMRLTQVRSGDGQAVSAELLARLTRDWTQLQQIEPACGHCAARAAPACMSTRTVSPGTRARWRPCAGSPTRGRSR